MMRFLMMCLFCVGCVEDPDSSRDPDDPQPAAEPESSPEPQPDDEPEPQPENEPEPMVRVPEKHRPAEIVCDDQRGPGSSPEPGASDFSSCNEDADCQDGANGRCTGNSHDGWNCTYDRCFDDSGCMGVCQCSGGFRSDANVCVGGDCQVNADCGPGGYCSPSFGDCGEYLGVVAFYCHTPEDECIDDADCEGEPQFGFNPYCAFDPGASHWRCSDSQCAGK